MPEQGQKNIGDRTETPHPQPGEKLPDGWIFLGLSAVTGRAFSLAPPGALPGKDLLREEAENLAAAFLAAGHKKARLPVEADYKKSELLQIFSIIALSPRYRYWMQALRPDDGFVLQQRKSDCFYANSGWSARALVVRDEP